MAKEFKQYAANMGIIVKNVPVEAHNSIGLVERYHGPLRRAYTIITEEMAGISADLALQMAFKAMNDTVSPNGLVPTLLVFGAYPRMVELDAPSPSITQRSTAMRRAMDELRKMTASRQVNDALNTRNGPFTTMLHDLPFNSPVLVFREGNTGQSGQWKGPYKLLGLDGETAIVELRNGPTKFRSTSVRPFYTEKMQMILGLQKILVPSDFSRIKVRHHHLNCPQNHHLLQSYHNHLLRLSSYHHFLLRGPQLSSHLAAVVDLENTLDLKHLLLQDSYCGQLY